MRRRHILSSISFMALLCASSVANAGEPVRISDELEEKVIEWRRDFHKNPELGNREFRTAAIVAAHLESLGLQVQTDVAHTGVIGVLVGGKPGPTVALRADMDALPVAEQTNLPFKSTAVTEFQGKEVGVMHACGHDLHIAMLMGAAQKLASMKKDIVGTIVFIFQPAEEGAPEGEEGGAELVLAEGIFEKYQPDAVFGLHVVPYFPVGHVGFREGPALASEDEFSITVAGRQTHGAAPWAGVDPIVAAAQIVSSTQSIVSRQVDITKGPSVVSFGIIRGGIRNNIIPDEVYMEGTIRNFDMDNRAQIFENLKTTAEMTARASGATATVKINEGYPVTINNPALTRLMRPTIERVAGKNQTHESPLITGSEDFSFYALKVPGLFALLGVTPEGEDLATAPANHSPFFNADEAALKVGTELLVNWTLDYAKFQD